MPVIHNLYTLLLLNTVINPQFIGIKRMLLDKPIKKNDIIYWKGHVALALSNKKLIHAYGPMKKTVLMNIIKTVNRIKETANLKVIAVKRI